mmetsp:Transcript_23955/g.48493  ORF Transcript_23955/g.48493 Transcript_23955/m.48493 type:complete len:391 (-) Transcript_23955:273-1445(-)
MSILSNPQCNVSNATTGPLFIHADKLTGSIPFDRTWMGGLGRYRSFPAYDESRQIPTHLHVPDFLEVFEYSPPPCDSSADDEKLETLTKMGLAAQQIIDACFSGSEEYTADAVLFRNMNQVIETGEDFSGFWESCVEAGNWEWAEHYLFTIPDYRPKGGGKHVDVINTKLPDFALPCHNEMADAPNLPKKTGLYCLQDSKQGGETVLCKNSETSKYSVPLLQKMVKERGGLQQRRKFHDENNTNVDPRKINGLPKLQIDITHQSWQNKTGAETREDAIRFFVGAGLKEDDEVFFDEDGSLVIDYTISGFTENGDWSNNLQHTSLFTTFADGTKIPEKLLHQNRRDVWKGATAFKMRPGDFMLVNNRKIQHGRLPYSLDGPVRTMHAVYAN